VTHDLLHDLWLHPTTDVAVSAVTVHANRVTVHATTTRAHGAWRTRLRRRSKLARPNI
jgi:hypothetical protein